MLQRVLSWTLPLGAEEDIPHFHRARGNLPLPCSISAHSSPRPANREHNLCCPHGRSYESVGGCGGLAPCRLLGTGFFLLRTVLCWGSRWGQKMDGRCGEWVE